MQKKPILRIDDDQRLSNNQSVVTFEKVIKDKESSRYLKCIKKHRAVVRRLHKKVNGYRYQGVQVKIGDVYARNTLVIRNIDNWVLV